MYTPLPGCGSVLYPSTACLQVADQSAAVFGACCFQSELIKVTMGTGTFANINTAGKPHASVKGKQQDQRCLRQASDRPPTSRLDGARG